MIKLASAGGTLGRAWVNGGGAWVSCAATIAWGDAPGNGGRPASIS